MKTKERINKMNMKNTINENKKLNLTEEIGYLLPSGLTEKQAIEKGFDIGVKLMTPLHGEKYAKNFIQKSFWYDEDFIMDFLAAYSYFGKKLIGTVPVTVYPKNPFFNPFESSKSL